MKLAELDKIPYRFSLESWDYEPEFAEKFADIVNLKLGEVGGTSFSIDFVPFFPKIPPFWPMGSLPDDTSRPIDAYHARYYRSCLSEFVITPDDELCGQVIRITHRNFDERTREMGITSINYSLIFFISSLEFEQLRKELHRNMKLFVPATNRVRNEPIKGKVLRKILCKIPFVP